MTLSPLTQSIFFIGYVGLCIPLIYIYIYMYVCVFKQCLHFGELVEHVFKFEGVRHFLATIFAWILLKLLK